MQKLFRGLTFAVLAASMMLASCTTAPGVFNGLGSDYMSRIIIYRTDKKALTYEQYRAVQEVAKEMNITLDIQLSSPFESGASNGAAYGAAGAVGGASQGIFYSGADAGASAGFTGTVYALGGVVNGLVTHSYGVDYATAEMTEKTMRDREADGEKVFSHIHVVAAFVRSRNNIDSPAPGLSRQMPDFSGAPAGAPAVQ